MAGLLVWLAGGLACMVLGTQRAAEDPETDWEELALMMGLYLVLWPLVLLCRGALALDAALEPRRENGSE